MKQNNVLNKISNFLPGRGRYYKRTTHPVRDWFIGLFTSFLVISIGGSLSTYFFLKYQDVYQSTTKDAEQSVVYNRAQAQKALEIYSNKKAFYNQKKAVSLAPIVVPEVATTTATTTQTQVENEAVPEGESPVVSE